MGLPDTDGWNDNDIVVVDIEKRKAIMVDVTINGKMAYTYSVFYYLLRGLKVLYSHSPTHPFSAKHCCQPITMRSNAGFSVLLEDTSTHGGAEWEPNM